MDYKFHTTGKPNSYSPKPERATKGTADNGLRNLDKQNNYKIDQH